MFLTKKYRERILQAEQKDLLLQDGWLAADLHVHSTCSPDVLPYPDFHPEAIYQGALKRGMGFVTITDHDTMEAYDIIGWERERLVPGVEMTLFDPVRVGHTIHVNVYELNKSQFLELKRIAERDGNLETFIDFLQDQSLLYTYNHPFWFLPKDKPNYRAVADIIDLFPVIEYNMKRIKMKNMFALWLAAKKGKGITASTDTHIGQMGHAFARGNLQGIFFQHCRGQFIYCSTRLGCGQSEL